MCFDAAPIFSKAKDITSSFTLSHDFINSTKKECLTQHCALFLIMIRFLTKKTDSVHPTPGVVLNCIGRPFVFNIFWALMLRTIINTLDPTFNKWIPIQLFRSCKSPFLGNRTSLDLVQSKCTTSSFSICSFTNSCNNLLSYSSTHFITLRDTPLSQGILCKVNFLLTLFKHNTMIIIVFRPKMKTGLGPLLLRGT